MVSRKREQTRPRARDGVWMTHAHKERHWLHVAKRRHDALRWWRERGSANHWVPGREGLDGKEAQESETQTMCFFTALTVLSQRAPPPRRAAAVRTNAAIDASLRGDNVRR